MKKNFAPILIVAFAMAVVCTAIFYGLVAGKLGQGAQANATPEILVAAHDIPRGASVSALDVKRAPWAGAVPDGAMLRPGQVDGLTAIADIAAGEPVLSSRVANKRSGGGLGIPSGMRAVSVQVHDSSGVVALMQPGHRVDVQAVYTRSGANQDAEIRTVLENIEVLKINPTAEPAPGRPALPVATLLVTPSDADTLGLADAVARVRLVLRNPLDQDKVGRSTLGATSLMRGSTAAQMVAVNRPLRQPSPVTISETRPPATTVSGLSLAAAGPSAPSCNPASKPDGATSK